VSVVKTRSKVEGCIVWLVMGCDLMCGLCAALVYCSVERVRLTFTESLSCGCWSIMKLRCARR